MQDGFVATLGTFDGVHRGHRGLLNTLRRVSRRRRLRSLAILFSEPPRFYFNSRLKTPLITPPSERAELLKSMGIDRIRILRFNRHWARMTHTRFFGHYLIRRCRVRGLVIGPDFAFGHGRKGNAEWLEAECRRLEMTFCLHSFTKAGRRKISSSRIRELLMQGDVSAARRLLGRPYRVEGRVTRGRGLGRKLGFPTANLRVPAGKLLPRGVYKVRVYGSGVGDAARAGACNIGTRPSVSGKSRLHVEVHIPGFSGNLYGKMLRLDFLKFLRPEKKFKSLAALKAQIGLDVHRAGR